MTHDTIQTEPVNERQLPPMRLPPMPRALPALATVAGAGLVAAVLNALFLEEGFRRLMLAYLVAFAFVLSLSLGALFFVVVQRVTRAAWSVVVRRPAEILCANFVMIPLLFLPIAWFVTLGHGEVYPWAQPVAVDSSEIDGSHGTDGSREADGTVEVAGADDAAAWLYAHQQLDKYTLKKRAVLNPTAFIVRWVVILAIWIAMGWYFWRSSVRQDTTRDVQATLQAEAVAGPAAVVLAFTLTIAAFDLLMSIDPHWYSTIFGAYYFAGSAVAIFAVLVLAARLLSDLNLVPGLIADRHHRDLGRLLFAFVFFWGYIAFSQYMLLWYANIPETTRWLVNRGMSTAGGYGNSWGWLVLLLLLGHFLLPFAALMSRHVKVHRRAMYALAAWLLLMHYADLYWIVMPELGPRLTVSLVEIGTLVAVTAIYLIGALAIARRAALVPLGDPRLEESLSLEEVY